MGNAKIGVPKADSVADSEVKEGFPEEDCTILRVATGEGDVRTEVLESGESTAIVDARGQVIVSIEVR